MGDDGIKDAFRTGRGTIRVRAAPRDRGRQARRPGDRAHRGAVPDQCRRDRGQAGRARGVGQDRRCPRHPQRVGPGQDPPRDRAARRREPADRAQQPVQAHRRADARSRSTWWRSSTACPARSTSRSACSSGSTTRWSSSPAGSQFRLDRANERLHIVEGLVKALDMIDAVVKAIRASKDRSARARQRSWAKRLRLLRDPGQPHPRHDARPAHAARPRGARQGEARSSTRRSRS